MPQAPETTAPPSPPRASKRANALHNDNQGTGSERPSPVRNVIGTSPRVARTIRATVRPPSDDPSSTYRQPKACPNVAKGAEVIGLVGAEAPRPTRSAASRLARKWASISTPTLTQASWNLVAAR
jgi:hypothetical protein